MKELIEIVAAMAAKKGEVENPRELFLDMAERVVKAVCSMFAAKSDEVAILIRTSDGAHLRFVAPRKFADLGTIPVTKRDSIAVIVLGRKAGEAMNNVPMVKHVAFFESVKLREKMVPIQKMITVRSCSPARPWAWRSSAARASRRPKPAPTSARPT